MEINDVCLENKTLPLLHFVRFKKCTLYSWHCSSLIEPKPNFLKHRLNLLNIYGIQ